MLIFSVYHQHTHPFVAPAVAYFLEKKRRAIPTKGHKNIVGTLLPFFFPLHVDLTNFL